MDSPMCRALELNIGRRDTQYNDKIITLIMNDS